MQESPVHFEHVIVDAQPPHNPWTKLAGDLNGDGRLDIAIGGQNGPLVWYANPDWTRHEVAAGGYSTVGGAVGDVDGDGDADIMPGAQVWFENPKPHGDPARSTWQVHRISDIGSHEVALVDLDRDGRLDLFARDQSGFGNNRGNRLHFWCQEGRDQWRYHAVDAPHGEGSVVTDLDRDGDLDVVIGGQWFENDGRVEGTWRSRAFTTNWTWADTKVAVGDLNDDGLPDVVLAPAEYQGQHYRLAWYEAPATAKQPDWPEHVVEAPVEAVMHGLAVADMDGDNAPDLVTARMHQGAAPQEVSVHLNQGQGRSWRKVVVSQSGSHDILVADFDGDGRPDILGANHGGTQQPVELWLNRTPRRAGAAADVHRLEIKVLERRPDVDTKRVAATGFSMGASIAMVLAWREPRVRVVVSVAGAVDFWWDVTKTPPGPDQEARKSAYGVRLRELVNAIDPKPHFTQIPPKALCLINGGRDGYIDLESIRRFVRDLEPRYAAEPNRLRFLPFPEQGHVVTGAMWKKAKDWIVWGLKAE